MKFLDTFLQRSGLVCQMMVITVSLCCGTGKPTGGSQDRSRGNARSISPSINQPTPSSTKSSIRLVDFANFTYQWYPHFLKPPLGRREMRLDNGHFEVGLDRQDEMRPVSVDLEHVHYADLTSDGDEDAIVYLAGSVPTNSFLGNLLIYTLQKGEPRLLWQHETGDRGNGGLRGFSVENGEFVVEEYVKEANPEQSLCCPKNFLRSYYRWNNGKFVRVRSAVIANEYSNAYFKGYPSDKR